jgi:hypothetical protein
MDRLRSKEFEIQKADGLSAGPAALLTLSILCTTSDLAFGAILRPLERFGEGFVEGVAPPDQPRASAALHMLFGRSA